MEKDAKIEDQIAHIQEVGDLKRSDTNKILSYLADMPSGDLWLLFDYVKKGE